jgi:hypothetical protein
MVADKEVQILLLPLMVDRRIIIQVVVVVAQILKVELDQVAQVGQVLQSSKFLRYKLELRFSPTQRHGMYQRVYQLLNILLSLVVAGVAVVHRALVVEVVVVV